MEALYLGGVAVKAREELAGEDIDEGEGAALVAHHALRGQPRRQRHARRRLPDGRALRRLQQRVLPQHKLACGVISQSCRRWGRTGAVSRDDRVRQEGGGSEGGDFDARHTVRCHLSAAVDVPRPHTPICAPCVWNSSGTRHTVRLQHT